MKLSKDKFEEMLLRYQREEITASALAAQYGVTSQTLLKSLRRRNITIRGEKTAARVGPAEQQRMLELYKSGQSTREIAKRLNRSCQAVCNSLRATGLILRDRSVTRCGRVDGATRKGIEALYVAGGSLDEVAETLGVTKQIVSAELERRGIAKRSVGRKTRFADEPEIAAQIIKGYENGCTIPLLAEVYHCSRDAIKKVLVAAGVTLRKDGPGKRVFQFIDRKGREFWMRSSWEIKTALFLDQQERNWDYEKESFEIGLRRRYTPDFWVYDTEDRLEKLLDVKGWLYPENEARIQRFRKSYPSLPFELWGQEELTTLGILALDLPVAPPGEARSGLRSRLSKEEIQEAVRLYESNMSTTQVAEALNRSESAVARQLQLLGKTRTRSETKKLLSADQRTRDLIAETYLSGLSISKTASKLGVSRDIVAKEVSDRGISRSRSCTQLLNNRVVS
jgi:IS30 family transposase